MTPGCNPIRTNTNLPALMPFKNTLNSSTFASITNGSGTSTIPVGSSSNITDRDPPFGGIGSDLEMVSFQI